MPYVQRQSKILHKPHIHLEDAYWRVSHLAKPWRTIPTCKRHWTMAHGFVVKLNAPLRNHMLYTELAEALKGGINE